MSRSLLAAVAALAAGLAVACLVPFFVDPATQGILSKMLIAALFATAFNLLAGQAGLLSFGHSTYFGIGAIAALHAMIWVENGAAAIPTPLLPLIGAVAGFLLAAVAGYFATIRTGTYFALVTLAMAELVYVIAPMWRGLFGGEEGLTSMRMPWLHFDFGSARQVYFLVLFWCVVSILGLWAISRTAFGQLLLALKENEPRLTFLGFNSHRTKILAFALSGGFSGLAGGLLAVANETANFSLFGADVSLQVVFHAFVGGAGIFLAPAIAAAILTVLPYAISDLTRAWPLYEGLIFMIVIFYAPNGVGGVIRDYFRESAKERMPAAVLAARTLAVAMIAASVVIVIESVDRLSDPSAGSFSPYAGILRLTASARPVVAVLTTVAAIAALSAAGVLLLQWRGKRASPRRQAVELTGAD